MTEERLVRISKYLCKHLRHSPEQIGLTLSAGGWVGVAELITASAAHKMRFTHEELQEVVEKNSKQRFSFDETGTRIRANQGHSVEVDLMLAPATPPDVLYHGTGHTAVRLIQEEGLKRMTRHHVHLSADTQTALDVGARHGRPVVFVVDARAMHVVGHLFFCSENGVWLTDTVPPVFLKVLENTT